MSMLKRRRQKAYLWLAILFSNFIHKLNSMSVFYYYQLIVSRKRRYLCGVKFLWRFRKALIFRGSNLLWHILIVRQSSQTVRQSRFCHRPQSPQLIRSLLQPQCLTVLDTRQNFSLLDNCNHSLSGHCPFRIFIFWKRQKSQEARSRDYWEWRTMALLHLLGQERLIKLRRISLCVVMRHLHVPPCQSLASSQTTEDLLIILLFECCESYSGTYWSSWTGVDLWLDSTIVMFDSDIYWPEYRCTFLESMQLNLSNGFVWRIVLLRPKIYAMSLLGSLLLWKFMRRARN